MKLVLLTLQQELIDNGYEAELDTVKKRTARFTVTREGKSHVSTWERYKNGELHIDWTDSDIVERHSKYPPGYDADAVLTSMRNSIRWFFVDKRPYIPRSVISKRKELAPPDKHVMNTSERRELTRLMQQSGKTEKELRQDPGVRRQLAEARALPNKPAGEHVFDGRRWLTPHQAATAAVTALRAKGRTGQLYETELQKALERARK